MEPPRVYCLPARMGMTLENRSSTRERKSLSAWRMAGQSARTHAGMAPPSHSEQMQGPGRATTWSPVPAAASKKAPMSRSSEKSHYPGASSWWFHGK
jgi:hypothetical protein